MAGSVFLSSKIVTRLNFEKSYITNASISSNKQTKDDRGVLNVLFVSNKKIGDSKYLPKICHTKDLGIRYL